MKALTAIWKFINSKIFGYLLILAFATLFLGTCDRNKNLKEEADRQEQNISALSDSIKTVHLKNGEIQASIDVFMASDKELRALNLNLFNEVNDQKGKVITLNRIVFNLVQDTTELRRWIANNPPYVPPPTQETDSTWDVPWGARYVYDSVNFDVYKGITKVGLRGPYDLSKVSVFHNETELTYRNSQIGLTWGQKWEGLGKDKRLKVFAQTAHPAFKAKLLEGTYVDYPKREHWLQGFGIGPQFGVGYDFLNNQPAFIIGIGIHYNIYQF
jgi:hypothetical protein